MVSEEKDLVLLGEHLVGERLELGVLDDGGGDRELLLEVGLGGVGQGGVLGDDVAGLELREGLLSRL